MEYCTFSFIFQTPCSQCTSRIARNPIVWSHKSFCQYTRFYFYFWFFIISRDCNIVILTISDELTSHSLTDIALTKTFEGYHASTDLLYLVFLEKFQLPLFSSLLLTILYVVVVVYSTQIIIHYGALFIWIIVQVSIDGKYFQKCSITMYLYSFSVVCLYVDPLLWFFCLCFFL